TIVTGTTNTDETPHGEDQFLLPNPMIFTVSSPAPEGVSIFPANSSTFGKFSPLEGTNAEGVMLSTPNSTVRALTCPDSFWDMSFQVATLGNTQGDTVTFFLQNPNGTNPQVVAIFTIENDGMKLTQLNKDVTLLWGAQQRPVGTVFPLIISGGPSGVR